jgi:ribose transport system substrate-binding protein
MLRTGGLGSGWRDGRRARRGAHLLLLGVAGLALTFGAAACGGGGEGGDGDDRFRISLIQSYSGNDWQNASANLVKAVAQTPPYDELVELDHQIAGTDPQQQSQLMAEAISAGADALVIYPISPTALNSVVKDACDQDVIVVTYDSWVTEPCAYNVHNDPLEMGRQRADWLAQHLNGQGKIAEIIGVAGTTFDSLHQQGVDEALEKYPNIQLVAREEGFWSQPGARDAIQKLAAAHPDLDGYIAQVGCWGSWEQLISLGKQPLPCAGDTANGHLLMMLPEGTEASSRGLPSIAVSETTFTGALAFMQAVKLLDGEERCHETMVPPIVYQNDDLKVGDDPTQFGTVYGAQHVPTVPSGFFVNFYSPLVGQGINGALAGIPDPLHEPEASEQVAGDDTPDGVAEQQGSCMVP